MSLEDLIAVKCKYVGLLIDLNQNSCCQPVCNWYENHSSLFHYALSHLEVIRRS